MVTIDGHKLIIKAGEWQKSLFNYGKNSFSHSFHQLELFLGPLYESKSTIMVINGEHVL